MFIDPTLTVEDSAQKLFIACAINAADGKPYPLVVDPTTGELRVNAEFTGEVKVELTGEGVTGDNVRLFYCSIVGAVVLTGAGLDDFDVLGRYLGTTKVDLRVKIDATGTPDTFTWSKDGGGSWEATGVPITGEEQVLEEGLTIIFAATTGHTLNDYWDCEVKPGFMINPRLEDGHGSESGDPSHTSEANSAAILSDTTGMLANIISILADTTAILSDTTGILADSGDIKTAVELIDDAIATVGAAKVAKAIQIAGQDGTNAVVLKVDSDGRLEVLNTDGTTIAEVDATLKALKVDVKTPLSGYSGGDDAYYFLLKTDQTLPSVILSGNDTVTTAGVAEQLNSGTPLALKRGVGIQALITNTGKVYVGGSNVDNANGEELTKGQDIYIETDDVSNVYIDVSVNGEGVKWTGS